MNIFFLVLMGLTLGFQSQVSAQDFPCVKLIQACKEAGFAWNKHKSKKINGKETQLKIDCLEKLVIDGPETVPSVKEINGQDIEACKKFRAEKLP